MRRISLPFLAAALCVLTAVGVTQAAVHRGSTPKHPKAVTHAKVHGLKAPGLLSPANGAHVQQVPTLTWSAVSGAIEYQYQVAADPKFHSIVLGKGPGLGSSTTHNLAAALGKLVTDGTYYWRVRGLTATKEPGGWSATRTLKKTWAQEPQLLGPAQGKAISWPSEPLILSWSPVQSATEYIVTIATDKELSHVVLGSATSPQKTDATVFALPGTLASGQTYYWAITPVDAKGHRGAISATRSFEWSWPTATTPSVSPLNAELGEAKLQWTPEFKWTPIPGAARYEVEASSAAGFPAGSKWCCSSPTIGTSFSPTVALNNNEYYWRVRAIDASGHAGIWNEGPRFTKAFDSVTPTIPGLRMSGTQGESLGTDPTTDTPIVTWSPVPGASSYEVQVAAYRETEEACDWGASNPVERQTVNTSTLAWTPLGKERKHIGPAAWPGTDGASPLNDNNNPYCVRVLARSDHDQRGNQVVSNWTQIGGANEPAFTFAPQPAPGSPAPRLETPASSYILPTQPTCTPWVPASEPCPRTPLFTWNRVPGASSYDVVIARDSGFTHVIDVASTVVPAYAPQGGGEMPLDDETTTYYWAVVPVNAKGEEFHEPPEEDAPQAFNKSSIAPTPLAPITSVNVSNQPTFKWSPAEGALNYTLQVAADPTFANPVETATTDSTAYTSSATYPAYGTLYWRVRANDTNTHNEGLNWSAVQTFQRTLPVPTPAPSNPTSSEAIPVLAWTPVTGAVGYNVHVEEPNGMTKDVTVDSPVETATAWAGPGIWRWEARALFPTASSATVPGGYFVAGPEPLAHTVAPPAGALGVKSGSRIVISWNPQAYAKEYEVSISTSDTFSSTIESLRIETASWVPNVDLTKRANKGTLYWRVAAVDNKSNLGPYATGRFVPPKPKCVVKKVKRKKKTVRVCVALKHKPAKKKHH